LPFQRGASEVAKLTNLPGYQADKLKYAKLPFCKLLPSFQAAKLPSVPNCKPAKLPSCRVAELSSCNPASCRDANYPIAKHMSQVLPNYKATKLPKC